MTEIISVLDTHTMHDVLINYYSCLSLLLTKQLPCLVCIPSTADVINQLNFAILM